MLVHPRTPKLCAMCNARTHRSLSGLCSHCRSRPPCAWCDEYPQTGYDHELCRRCWLIVYHIAFRSDIEKRRKRDSVKHKAQVNKRNKERRRLGLVPPLSLKARLAMNVRSRIGYHIKKFVINKPGSMSGMLGCSWDDLKAHLEKQFYSRSTGESMSWDNYGVHGWHVDHRRPLCSFDLNDPDQAAEVVHFSNLQPLWCEDNARKASRDREFSYFKLHKIRSANASDSGNSQRKYCT